MVKQLVVMVVVGLLMTSFGLGVSAQVAEVGIVQIVEHPALDAARTGFLQALDEQGIQVNVSFHSAQGDFATAAAISQQFVADRKDLILAIATPAAQAAAHATEDIPIVFTAVTDPVAAGLVESWEVPGKNVTGSSDMTPVARQLELLTEIAPQVKRVGIIFNPGESNSQVQVELAEQAATELGLTLVKAGVNSSAEVMQAASSLVGRVEALYVPTDNTVASAIDSVVLVAEDNDLPLIVGEDTLVERGALATLGINYFELGYEAGLLASKILSGADPAELSVTSQQEFAVALNLAAAEQIGLTFPQGLLEKAATVVE